MKEAGNLRIADSRQNSSLTEELNYTLQMQAGRISKLLEENERLGVDLQNVKAKFDSLVSLLNCSSEKAEREIESLIEWKKLAQEKLASTIDGAQKQVDLLWNCHKELNSSSHRFVSFVEKKFVKSSK